MTNSSNNIIHIGHSHNNRRKSKQLDEFDYVNAAMDVHEQSNVSLFVLLPSILKVLFFIDKIR